MLKIKNANEINSTFSTNEEKSIDLEDRDKKINSKYS